MMESLANYGSDEEIDAAPSTSMKSEKSAVQHGLEGDNYDDVQMEMSENPLNGSKAPSSVQAQSLGWSGGAPPRCSTLLLESGSESVSKEDGSNSSPHNSNHSSSSSSSPASAASTHDDDNESEEEPCAKPEETQTMSVDIVPTSKDVDTVDKEKDQSKRDLDNRRDREKDRERDRDRDRERVRERGRDRDERDRRKDFRRDDRHRSRSRDRRDKRKSPDRSDRRRSRDREERKRANDRRSSSRERRRRESDRRHSDTNRRESDRKHRRTRSRSTDRHRPGVDSRSSSSSASSKDARTALSGATSGSRSRSKSIEKERSRPAACDARKFYLDKKIDRKMNVLERMGIELKAEAKPGGLVTVTPQMLVQRTMEQQAAQVKLATGVELPSYYNAAAVNPQRLVDQIQKRKLLWGGKKEEVSKAVAQPSSNKWQGATFAQDQDGKLTAKFNRLMGIKAPAQVAPEVSPQDGTGSGSEIIKKQEEMFHNMESQYEVARLATHTHRGLGLGFGTFQPR